MNFRTALGRYLSEEQLNAIGSIRVGIAGAGGLGSNCAAYLTRSGFRRFTIVDCDIVEPTNLNRQFFFADQIGLPKVKALAQNLMRIETELSLELFQRKIDSQNVGQWFIDCQVVIECLDGADVKALLVEHYVPLGKLVVAVSGIAGWGNSDGIVVRRLGSNFYVVGDEKSDIDTLPPLAPRVAIAAAKQADIVLDCVLGNFSERGKMHYETAADANEGVC